MYTKYNYYNISSSTRFLFSQKIKKVIQKLIMLSLTKKLFPLLTNLILI